MKLKNNLKRILAGIMSLSITASVMPYFPTFADEQAEPYPYTMFAASSDEGAITLNIDNSCINGNITTNGTIMTTAQNFNVNGQRIENADENMIFIMDKIYDTYFAGSEVERIDGDYSIEDININIFSPVDVSGNIELNGNVNLNAGIKSVDDINITGTVKNTNNSVICSQTGDITINSSNVNFSGLIYAPYGDILIDSDNLNLNNIVIIGQTITIECPSFNANYNSYIGEFIGNCCNESFNPDNPENPDIPDKPVIDSEAYIFANGKYNSDTSAIDIEWFTESEINTFDIWESYDNTEYVLVDTIMNTNSYQYDLTEDFETKYFKVSFTENENSTIESIPFSVVKKDDGYEIVLIDTDEDGLADIYEMIFGTDPQLDDTDGDTLSDYQEVYLTGTDPTVYDSVTEGVSDADADSDGDRITNIDEINYGTNPQLSDTDEDGLSDYDEIYVYGTDPLSNDSDEDGLNDGIEIKLGLDPKNPETYGAPDSEYQIYQPLDSENDIFIPINKDDSPYKLSIDITSNNDIEENIYINESGRFSVVESDIVIGHGVDIEISNECSPSNIVLKYTIDEDYIDNDLGTFKEIDRFNGIKRLAVFKYFEEINALLPLNTEYDLSNNIMSVAIESDGTYFVIDTEKWLDELGITANDLISEETTSPMLIKNPSVNILSAEEASSTENIGKGASGNFFENKPVDLIFAIQNCGFGEEAKQKFEFEKKLIRDISDYAFKKYDNVRVHLIAYNIQWSETNASIGGVPVFWGIKDVEDALNKIEYYPNYSVANRAIGYYLAYYNACRLSYHPNSEKFVFNLTNFSTYYNDLKYGFEYEYQAIYSYFYQNDMHFSHIFDGGYNENTLLKQIINGDYSDPMCNEVMSDLIGHDGVDLTLDITTKNNYNDIIENLNKHIKCTSLYGAYSTIDWQKKILGAELAEDKPFDTDGDTVPDWQEIDTSKLIIYEDGSFDLPTVNDLINLITNESERESVLNFLYDNTPVSTSAFRVFSAPPKDSSMADIVLNLKVLPTVSDPTTVDSDNDGYTDVDDPEPYNPPKYLEGKYDFLDGEIYSILYKGSNNNMYCFELSGGSISNGTPIVQTSCDGTEKQRFRFKWHDAEGGYTIHPIANELMTLTLNTSSFEVRLTTYTRTNIFKNQIWEVIPCENSTNVIIRSKYIDSNDSLAKSYYLSLDESSNALICKTDEKQKFNISNPTYNWKRFGEIYLSYIGFPEVYQQPESPYFSSIYYYYQNIKNGLGASNIKPSGISNYNVLYNQSEGSFTKLHFAASKMSDTACEIIATYNALAVIGEYDCYKSGVLTNDIDKFFRLSAEFQLNAMYIINGGWFGSDTSKIGDCLSVYNHGYEVYNENELKMFDAYLRNKKAKGAIVSYDNFGFLNLRIHTFYCYYDAVKNKCIDFNLWGNEPAEDLCEESSIEEVLNKLNENKGARKFRIGYILI